MADEEKTEPLSEDQQKEVAVEWFFAMWEEAIKRGVSNNIMASISLSGTISQLVRSFGEEAVAGLIEKVPDQVRAGDFTVQEPEDAEPSNES